MRRVLGLMLLLVFASWGGISAEEKPEQKLPKWHPRDLQYYDENGVVKKLELVPKLAVRFAPDLKDEQKSALWASFSPVGQASFPGDHTRLLVEFSADTSAERLLWIVNEIAQSGLAEAVPVFEIENLEAVIEGISVETKIVLGAERILERMKRHGEFSVRQTRPENGKWIFLIDEVRPPLNILVLTNLFHQDSWVRRAYPYFKFLHDPITATINVEPVSGTVGEVRTATFTVKVFDPAIELSTDLLPQFGEGLFLPLQSGRQPPGYLFERLGDPVKRELRDKQSRLYVFSRRFKHHALGEWHISAQPVSFTKNGVPQEIKSSGVTFVVNSQIGALNITDMPQPQSLIHLAEAPAVTPQVELPQAPVYWFDKYRWVADPDGVAGSLRSAAVPLGSFSAAMLYVLFLLWAARGKKQMVERHEKLWRLERRMDGAKAEGSYQKYEEALLAILRVAFPHLPSRPTREGVKADESIRGLWGAEKLGVLGRIFEELDRRYMKDFTPDPKTLLVLDRDIRSLFETVRRDLISGKEVG